MCIVFEYRISVPTMSGALGASSSSSSSIYSIPASAPHQPLSTKATPGSPMDECENYAAYFNDFLAPSIEYNRGAWLQVVQKVSDEFFVPQINRSFALDWVNKGKLLCHSNPMTGEPYLHELESQSRTQFKEKYSNRFVYLNYWESPKKCTAEMWTLLELWENSPVRLNVKIIFYPYPCGQQLIASEYLDQNETHVRLHNLFSDVKFTEDMARQKCPQVLDPNINSNMILLIRDDPLLYHLFHVLCAGSMESFMYFMKWLAYCLKTRQKTGTAIVFFGLHGTGKGIFTERLSLIWGEHFIHCQSLKDLHQFGPRMRKALMVFCDEVSCTSNAQYQEFKTFITQPIRQARAPFEKATIDRNYLNCIVNSNCEPHDFMPSEANERRFSYFRVSEKMIPTGEAEAKKYWTQVATCDMSLFVRVLYELNIEGFTPSKALDNEELLSTRILRLESFPSWWYHCLCTGQIVGKNGTPYLDWTDPNSYVKCMWVSTDHLYESYVLHCGGSTKARLRNVWGANMVKYSAGHPTQHHRIHGYTISHLREARQAFITRMWGKNWKDAFSPSVAPNAQQVQIEADKAIDVCHNRGAPKVPVTIHNVVDVMREGMTASAFREARVPSTSSLPSALPGVPVVDEDMADTLVLEPPSESSLTSNGPIPIPVSLKGVDHLPDPALRVFRYHLFIQYQLYLNEELDKRDAIAIARWIVDDRFKGDELLLRMLVQCPQEIQRLAHEWEAGYLEYYGNCLMESDPNYGDDEEELMDPNATSVVSHHNADAVEMKIDYDDGELHNRSKLKSLREEAEWSCGNR